MPIDSLMPQGVWILENGLWDRDIVWDKIDPLFGYKVRDMEELVDWDRRTPHPSVQNPPLGRVWVG